MKTSASSSATLRRSNSGGVSVPGTVGNVVLAAATGGRKAVVSPGATGICWIGWRAVRGRPDDRCRLRSRSPILTSRLRKAGLLGLTLIRSMSPPPWHSRAATTVTPSSLVGGDYVVLTAGSITLGRDYDFSTGDSGALCTARAWFVEIPRRIPAVHKLWSPSLVKLPTSSDGRR